MNLFWLGDGWAIWFGLVDGLLWMGWDGSWVSLGLEVVLGWDRWRRVVCGGWAECV